MDDGIISGDPRTSDQTNGRKRKLSDSSNDFDSTVTMEPQEMFKYAKSLLNLMDPDKRTLLKVFHKFDKATYIPHGHTNDSLKVELARYLRLASAKSRISACAATTLILDFLQDPRSVHLYPDFPVKPVTSPYHLFCRQQQKLLNNKETVVSFLERGKLINAKWSKDTDAQAMALKQWTKSLERYKIKLDDFLVAHPEFDFDRRHDYIRFVDKLKQNVQSQIDKQNSNPKKGTGKKTAIRKTAFELYTITKKNKYTDLDEPTREKKLRKRFEKLNDDQRSLLEDLAKNQD